MRRTIVLTMAAVTFAAGLSAQQPANSRQAAQGPAPAKRPRVGYAGAPAPTPSPQRPTVIGPTYYYLPNGVVAFVPTYVILTDGSALVNFGSGYERVIRPCAAARPAAPNDPYARDALGRIPEPPGIAAMRTGSSGQLAVAPPARDASVCYRPQDNGSPQLVTSGGP